MFMDVNKVIESNSLRYNLSIKRIFIVNEEEIIENFLNKNNNEEFKIIVFKEEFIDIYLFRYIMD